MKAIVYRLQANNEENIEEIMNSYELPTMQDVDVNEYRGYDIILSTYEVELSEETVLELAGMDAEELEFSTLQEIATEISADDLMDYIDSEGLEKIEDSILEELSQVNSESDNLIDEVMAELAHRLGRRYFKKYDNINGRSIRIANHTHNPMNGKCDINVVIAEQDKTQGKFATAIEDLVFCNNAKVNDIVEAILNY